MLVDSQEMRRPLLSLDMQRSVMVLPFGHGSSQALAGTAGCVKQMDANVEECTIIVGARDRYSCTETVMAAPYF